LRQVKTIKVVIGAAKARDAKTCDPTPAPTIDSRPDWCHIHGVTMGISAYPPEKVYFRNLG
jgi:hypothetical protein